MQRLANPYPLFVDGRGALMDAGYIYVGEPFSDPRTSPIDLFTDQSLTIPINQPLRTLGGFIVEGENQVFIYMAEDDYSIRVEDANNQLVEYVASSALSGGVAYQPLDSTLSLLSGLTTTSYGRALLNLANQATLQAAVGQPSTLLSKSGGEMSGDISRSGAGVYVYHNDSALTSGRIFVTAAGDPDPTSLPGDIWLQTS
jgi:hypothetical protein